VFFQKRASPTALGEDANAAMDRYALGDDAAFAELYDLIGPKLLTFLERYAGNAAEDLVQQTFLQMHCARESYVTGAPVLPWAFAIARRLAIDSFRKRKREILDSGACEDILADFGLPDDALRSKRAAQIIHRTLEELPEAQRAAFELVKYDGLSFAQAAEVLGTTVMAVRLRAHRTYKALRAALEEDAE
jgi:RNA polymerase sigma-70 factor (ECF subfamily)